MNRNTTAFTKALYAYIQIPSFREMSDYPDSISINLDWIKNDNDIILNFDAGEDIRDIQVVVNEVCHKLVLIMQDSWLDMFEGRNYHVDTDESFEYKYQNHFNPRQNNKKVTFEISKRGRVIFLNNIHDEVNPDHDYGFNFPAEIFQL